MFNMNILHITGAITVGLFVMLIIATIGAMTCMFGIDENDNEKKRTKTMKRFAIICLSLFIASMLATTGVVIYYNNHGAFYDDAWRDAKVDEHFIWDTKDTEFLQSVYDSDPEAFRPELYNVILVRLGCKDCENIKDILLSAKDEGEIYIIFSRSEIGKVYVEYYNITHVPCAILDNVYVPLYDEDDIKTE